MSIIRANNLQRTYVVYERSGLLRKKARTVPAVSGVDLEVEEGAFLGYIGPNGAGKSTTIKMLTGILKPTAGELEILGMHPFFDRKRYVRHIGAVFGQKTQMWWDLPVGDSYEMLRGLHRIPGHVYEKQKKILKDRLELGAIWKQPVRQLSLGQRMRAELGAAVLHNPKVLFLDEPTIGLDVVTKRRVKAFLKELNGEGTTILMTSHDLADIESLCESLLILDEGKVVYSGNTRELNQLTKLPTVLRIRLKELPSKEEDIHRLTECFSGHWDPEALRVELQVPADAPYTDVLQQVLQCTTVADLQVSEPEIEDIIHTVFLKGNKPKTA